jgi:hypothetical protein
MDRYALFVGGDGLVYFSSSPLKVSQDRGVIDLFGHHCSPFSWVLGFPPGRERWGPVSRPPRPFQGRLSFHTEHRPFPAHPGLSLGKDHKPRGAVSASDP